MNTQLTVQDRLNRYEIAQETLGFMMAMRTEAIHDEKQKNMPDASKIAKWREEVNQLDNELYALRLNDEEAIQRVLDNYCPVVKAEYERSRGVV